MTGAKAQTLSNKFAFWLLPDPKANREPLYTLGEVAERLKLDEARLRMSLALNRSEGAPVPARPASRNGPGGSYHLYRLSDFRKYLKSKETPQ